MTTPMSVLNNDSDADGDTLGLSAIASPPAHGTVQIINGKTLSYTAVSGYSGPDSLVYTMTDNAGGSATATISINVLNTPDAAPTAANDGPIIIVHNTATVISPRANDSDPDGDPLTIIAVTPPAHGAAAINGEGTSVTYTPATGYSGADSFGYTIWDGRGASASATVSLTVLPQANRAPSPANDNYTLVKSRAQTLAVRGNDTDVDGDLLAITAVSAPAHGTATIAAGGASIAYTPSADYVGADAFTYTVSDGRGGSANAQVSLTMVANRPPVTVEDVVRMSYGSEAPPLVIDVLANDRDPDGDGLRLIGVQEADETFAADIDNGRIIFKPRAGSSGFPRFYYTIEDTHGATAFGYVTVVVGQVVLAQPDSFVMQAGTSISILGDVLANDSNTSGAPVTLNTLSSAPSHGTATYNSNAQTLIYKPSPGFTGTDSFLYNIADGYGGGATGTVTINVVASVINRPPKTGPAYFEVPGEVATPLPQLLSRATDPDGDPLTISVPAGETTAKVVNGVVVYTPRTGAYGADSFTYTISDGRGGSTTGYARVLIRYNTPPRAADDSFVAQAGVTTPMSVLNNDSDPDGDTLSLSAIASPPAHGTVQIVNGKTLSYTAVSGYSGPDSLVYTLTDNAGGSSTATVVISVSP